MSVEVILPFSVQEKERMSLSFVVRPVSGGSSPVTPLRKCSSVRQAGREVVHCKDCEKARNMLPSELAKRMEMSKTLLLLDCRSFISYNLNHINGALNVSCCDRLTKRRLQGGKACVADLVSGDDAKTLFRELVQSEIVVYDEKTADISHISQQSSLHCVLTALLKEGKDVSVLKGGLQEFQTHYTNLCVKPHLPGEGKEQVYSPTTPFIEPQIETATASMILPHLYLGNARDAANRERLQELGITHILNMTSHLPLHFEGQGITYKRLPASDSANQNLRQYFKDAFDFIDEAAASGGRVLVHCQAGVSRSATITIAYIMQRTCLNMVEAYKFIKNKRSIIAPNFNFMGQLLEFETGLKSGLVSRHLHPVLPIDNCI